MSALLRRPNLVVISSSHAVAADLQAGVVRSAAIAGQWNGTVVAKYWVDGSDAGDFVGLLGLPYVLGTDSSSAPYGDNDVQEYSYRWTAVQGDGGIVPRSAPPYYSQNRGPYRAGTAQAWAIFKSETGFVDGSSAVVNPFAIFDAQGLIDGTDPEEWDVNAGVSSATSVDIARMLNSNPEVESFLAARGLPSVYAPGTLDPAWANVDWVADKSPLAPEDRQWLIGQIEQAVKDRAFGLLWFIRSGEMLSVLKAAPGGANVQLNADWSLANELNTPDGMPILMYQREGRRVVTARELLITDICPTFSSDALRGPICTSVPHYFRDGIAVDDYPVDIHSTGTKPPYVFIQPRPFQIPYSALVPVGTRNILVGGAIGADRLAYSSARVDSVRMMIGTAIGEALSLAARKHIGNLASMNIELLRERLALDGQETSYVSSQTFAGLGGESAAQASIAAQILLARGCLLPHWSAALYGGTAFPNAALRFEGGGRLRLRAVLSPACRRQLVRGSRSRKVTTVGGAYRMLVEAMPAVLRGTS